MADTKRLKEKYGPWALVTGSSSGIGEQFARQLAAAGLNLMLVARRGDRLEALATELRRAHGVEVEPVAIDLGVPEGVGEVLARMGERDFGLIVSNAGFGLKGRFEDDKLETLDAMLNVNLRTPLVLLHTLLPRLRRRRTSGVILTGSIEGEAAFPWSAAYAATKAFVHSLGFGLYGELSGSGIDLLVLAPGSTDTDAPILQGISRDALFGVMPPSEVAAQALQQLGKKPLHIPGWHNRLLVGVFSTLPRKWGLAAAGKAMAATLAKSGHPIKT